jgi:hypothetical protein
MNRLLYFTMQRDALTKHDADEEYVDQWRHRGGPFRCIDAAR